VAPAAHTDRRADAPLLGHARRGGGPPTRR
jgi:hypothetical protein